MVAVIVTPHQSGASYWILLDDRSSCSRGDRSAKDMTSAGFNDGITHFWCTAGCVSSRSDKGGPFTTARTFPDLASISRTARRTVATSARGVADTHEPCSHLPAEPQLLPFVVADQQRVDPVWS